LGTNEEGMEQGTRKYYMTPAAYRGREPSPLPDMAITPQMSRM